jgi:hypothetical protein
MSTRKTNGAKKTPEFVARAEGAFARVARKMRAESRKLGLPAVAFPNGRPQGVQWTEAERRKQVPFVLCTKDPNYTNSWPVKI